MNATTTSLSGSSVQEAKRSTSLLQLAVKRSIVICHPRCAHSSWIACAQFSSRVDGEHTRPMMRRAPPLPAPSRSSSIMLVPRTWKNVSDSPASRPALAMYSAPACRTREFVPFCIAKLLGGSR